MLNISLRYEFNCLIETCSILMMIVGDRQEWWPARSLIMLLTCILTMHVVLLVGCVHTSKKLHQPIWNCGRNNRTEIWDVIC